MSEENQKTKGRLPDGYAQIEKDGYNGKKQYFDIGPVWNSKDGYVSGQTVFGKLLIQPRVKREELEKLRKDKKAGPDEPELKL